jgi:hypothetical protein
VAEVSGATRDSELINRSTESSAQPVQRTVEFCTCRAAWPRVPPRGERHHGIPGSRRDLPPHRGPCADQLQPPHPAFGVVGPGLGGTADGGVAPHGGPICGLGWWCGGLRPSPPREQGRDSASGALPRPRGQARTESPNSEGWHRPRGRPPSPEGKCGPLTDASCRSSQQWRNDGVAVVDSETPDSP